MESKEDIVKVLEELVAKQKEIDQKTKSAEDYRELNLKLIQHSNITHIMFGVLIFVYIICNSMIFYHLIDNYLDVHEDIEAVEE